MLYILKVREKDRSSNKFMNSMTSLSLSHSHVSCLYWNKALCFTHPLGSHFLSTTLITTSQREFDTYQKSGYHSEHGDYVRIRLKFLQSISIEVYTTDQRRCAVQNESFKRTKWCNFVTSDNCVFLTHLLQPATQPFKVRSTTLSPSI